MAHDNQTGAKISGYLEKKGKLRMVSSWKKYWFVLEGRLLLYYRSKAEYDGLGPCKGSITLGTPCNIKPALASSCIFQIETRASTATLRAENRFEQDKWMQAILAALNQTTASPTKMSHFRYSADDLVPTPTSDNKKTQKPIFSRQNTMPERLSKGPQKEKTIIERLQTLGAHSYGGSLQTINKIANKISPRLPKNENLKRFVQRSESRVEASVNQENTLYAKVEKVKSNEEEGVTVENTHYAIINPRNSTQSETIEETNEQVVVENENYVEVDKTEDLRHTYEDATEKKHIYQEIGEAPVLVENLEYSTIENLDHNENRVTEIEETEEDDNSTYSEPIYREPKLYDLPVFSRPPEDRVSQIYEEPHLEPELPPRPTDPETSSQSSNEQKPKKSNTIRKLARLVSDARRDGLKRSSFVVRMLRRIRRSDDKDGKAAETVVVDSQDEIKVLNHLQKLLDNKKQIIEEKIKTSVSEEHIVDLRRKDECDVERAEYVEIDEEKDEPEVISGIVTPTLPPKHKYNQETKLDYAGFCAGNALNIPRPKLIQKLKKHRRSTESVADEKLKTIDEILDDLDSERREQNGRHKVKQLIEKFNVHSEEVELRKKCSPLESEHLRHSDDLNRLLAELSKVTNAPILTPGVTTSLISTPLTSDEWKNLVPIRKRRFSEPDYDIPRPHSSLQIIPSFESKENSMKPTRFFGPVLIDHEVNGETKEKHVSITPDSLEVEHLYQAKLVCASSIEEDRSLFSYTSHNYAGEMKTLDKKLTREEIYSRPKSLTSPQQSIAEDDVDEEYQEVRVKERFEDSLEPVEFLQNSTVF